jgi:hypothetical protein
MRIVDINGASSVERAAGERWLDLWVYVQSGSLYTDFPQDLVDEDIFIFDLDKVQPIPEIGEWKPVVPQIIERVAAGGLLIVLATTQNVPWLPVQFQARGYSGQQITIEQGGPELLTALLEKYHPEITYKTQFNEASAWTPLARAKNNHPVAGFASYGSGLILMLPEFKNRGRFLRELLDKVVPVMLPNLVEAQVTPDEDAPDWLSAFPVNRAEALAQEVDGLDVEIQRLREAREAKEREMSELSGYQGLLWLDGKPLEKVVEKALNLLGVSAHPKPPVDLVHSAAGGKQLFIEIEGTTTQIQVKKGRQLMGYIAESDDPAETLGAIVGNPFRLDPPSNRPPGNQTGLFSPQLESLAKKQSWKLFTTVELFKFVCRYLDGDATAVDDLRTSLGLL